MREGYALYRKGWYGPARGRFRQAILTTPSSARAYLWLARCAFKIGYMQEARNALDRAIGIEPGSEAAKEAKALLVVIAQ
jgi:tetratricopeptide (TPR) repeat protein